MILKGIRYTEIGKRLNLDPSAISKHAKRYGLVKPRITRQDQIRIIKEKLAENYSVIEIAYDLGLKPGSVYSIMSQNKIKAPHGRKAPPLCKVWHERLKANDPESLFKDINFVESNFQHPEKCHDYKKVKGDL